jgi:hypothetical protein
MSLNCPIQGHYFQKVLDFCDRFNSEREAKLRLYYGRWDVGYDLWIATFLIDFILKLNARINSGIKSASLNPVAKIEFEIKVLPLIHYSVGYSLQTRLIYKMQCATSL